MRNKDVMNYKQLTAFLQRAYNNLNQDLFDNSLPQAVITVMTSPGVNGHFVTGKIWKVGDERAYEINIGAESLHRGTTRTIATLIHEMVHFYNLINGIKDTSRQGRYHNSNFKAQAERRMLIIDHDKSIGYSITTPSDDLIKYVKKRRYPNTKIYRDLFAPSDTTSFGGGDDNNEPSAKVGKNGKIKKPSSTRKYVCPECGMSVRATKEVHLQCLDCQKELILEQ